MSRPLHNVNNRYLGMTAAAMYQSMHEQAFFSRLMTRYDQRKKKDRWLCWLSELLFFAFFFFLFLVLFLSLHRILRLYGQAAVLPGRFLFGASSFNFFTICFLFCYNLILIDTPLESPIGDL